MRNRFVIAVVALMVFALNALAQDGPMYHEDPCLKNLRDRNDIGLNVTSTMTDAAQDMYKMFSNSERVVDE